MGIDQATLNIALSNPNIALNALDKFESEQSLINFIKLGWASLEPGVEFVDNWCVHAICDHLEAVTSGQIRRLLINVPPGFTKALAIETPVFTLQGWIDHGDLKKGDYVFNLEGYPRLVKGITPHTIQDSYKVTFSCGASIIAAHGHLWQVIRNGKTKVVKTNELIFSGNNPDSISHSLISEMNCSGVHVKSKDGFRVVESVVSVGKRKVNCIQVEDSLYLAGKDLVLTHNSMTTNVFWPAWEWGPKELSHYRYLSFSHEQKLAIRDNVRCRDLIQQEWYQNIWGNSFKFKSDQNAKIFYENDITGWRQACAAASLVGRRGDRVIGDDPHSVEGADSEIQREEVLRIFSETVPTRLNKQAESAIVVIMQRVNELDVSGLILAQELGYEHVMLPMEFEKNRRCYSIVKPSYIKNPKKKLVYFDKEEKAWTPEKSNQEGEIRQEKRYNIDARKKDGELLDPIRFPRQAVDELKKALSAWGGTYAESGQLQQRPAPRGGGMFKKDDFKIIDNIREFKGKIVRGWDFAASSGTKSPYSAGVKMMMTQDERLIILDVNRFRLEPGLLEDEIKRTCEVDGNNVIQDMPQDPGQAGKTQKTALIRLLHGLVVNFSPETGIKEDRAKPLAAQAWGGNVYLLRGSWNNDYINEAALFPAGQYKDQIDASSRAYSALLRKKPKKVPAAPSVISA